MVSASRIISGISAALLTLFLTAALLLTGGCSWFQGDVAREEFDNLSGRVTKLEDSVYKSSSAYQPFPGSGSDPGLYGSPGVDPAFAAAFPAAGVSAGPSKATASERTRYNRARSLLKSKKYAQAANAFSEMLRDFPQGSLAPNARYWLGECRYAAGDFQGALAEFRQGFIDYPNSLKGPDYLLKISYCQSRLGDGPGAMENIRRLLASYPESDSAKLVRSGRTHFPVP
jgi:tol-pal system protein YbgF